MAGIFATHTEFRIRLGSDTFHMTTRFANDVRGATKLSFVGDFLGEDEGTNLFTKKMFNNKIAIKKIKMS